MSRKRARKGAVAFDNPRGSRKRVPALPNEILLEIWHQLPPLERVCVSQVCKKWRSMTLAVPSLWTHVALVDNTHERCTCPPRRLPNTREIVNNVYYPRKDAFNALSLIPILRRSLELPLTVTVVPGGCGAVFADRSFEAVRAFAPNRHRITRLHLAEGTTREFQKFLEYCIYDLPALRTLTAGFDDREIYYRDLPRTACPSNPSLLVLNQVILGASATATCPWRELAPLDNVQELTLTPAGIASVIDALAVCNNLSRLTIVLLQFDPPRLPHGQLAADAELQGFLDDVARVPQLCFSNISAADETFLLTLLNDARFPNLTLDYGGRVRRAGSSWYSALPSPCDALTGPVRLALTMCDGVYGVSVVDAADRRREILLDRSTIRNAPGLWNCYLKNKTVDSATVDAAAWDYFTAGLPNDCAIPDLTIVVRKHAAELQTLALDHFSNLHKLRIELVSPSLKLASASVRDLVRSRAANGVGEALLPVLSLSSNAAYDSDYESCLADVGVVLER